MSENSIMAFKCLNPECQKVIKLSRPAKTGVYEIKCPHCGVQKKLNIKGLDSLQEQPATGETPKAITPPTPPAAPDNSLKEAIELREDFLIDTPYEFTCPHCNKQPIGFNTDKPGHRTISCPLCKGRIGFDVRKKTEVIYMTQQLQLFRGQLTLLRKGWLNKTFPLHEGKNVIGRYDEELTSDIAIKNDPNMSRRSVEVEVLHSDRGYTFKLTVLKATNPVLHNDTPLMTGESVSLNFGDCIAMGKTKFRFEKAD